MLGNARIQRDVTNKIVKNTQQRINKERLMCIGKDGSEGVKERKRELYFQRVKNWPSCRSDVLPSQIDR